MRIFDLLLDNIFFIVIVIAFLLSFTGKLKQGKAAEDSPRPMMPPFGGEPVLGRQRGTMTKSEPVPSPRDAAASYRTEETTNNHNRTAMSLSPITDRINVPAPAPAPMRPLHGTGNGSGSKDISGSPGLVRVSENEVVQGMIWAEIFGPPRSKSPHRSPRFRS